MYEPLSFDLADADGIKDKARRWRGHLSAVEDGATDDIELHFLVGKPGNKALLDAVESAIDILEGAPFHPTVFTESNIDDLIDEIEDDFRTHKNN